jgi:hypothetical protein
MCERVQKPAHTANEHQCTRVTPLGYADREKTQRWAVLITPVSTNAPTHASSHNHASAPPSTRRRCACAHTARETAAAQPETGLTAAANTVPLQVKEGGKEQEPRHRWVQQDPNNSSTPRDPKLGLCHRAVGANSRRPVSSHRPASSSRRVTTPSAHKQPHGASRHTRTYSRDAGTARGTRTPTHASSHNHASAPPSARRLCTRAHTDRHTVGQPTACAARDAVPRHTRTHARTQPHPRISTTHRGRAEAHRGRRGCATEP